MRLNKQTFVKLMKMLIVILLANNLALLAGQKKFTLEDAMKFTAIKSQEISDNGRWVAYHIEPDRGDPTAFVKMSDEFENNVEYVIERGVKPIFTNDSKWVAMLVKHKFVEIINDEKNTLTDSLALINLETGNRENFHNIKNFQFSEDSQWLVYELTKEKNNKNKGNDIILRHLETEAELPLQNVTNYSFDTTANYFVYSVENDKGGGNGLYFIRLQGLFNFPQKIIREDNSTFSNLTWNNNKGLLAFIKAKYNKEDKPDSTILYLWDSRMKTLKKIVDNQDTSKLKPPKDWILPFKNTLKWSKDGERLFFGFKPNDDTSETKPKIKFTDSTLYNVDSIMALADLDLWHWNDPIIKTNEKKWWNDNKNRTFKAVYHLDADFWVQLADKFVDDVQVSENPKFTIGYRDEDYLKEITWNGWFQDLYKINLLTGEKTLIVKRLVEPAILSPDGNYVAYYKEKNWYSYNCNTDTTIWLNENMSEVPFYNVIHDEPSDPPSYGFGGWLENDAAMLIYDQWDIWKFYPNGEGYLNMTAADGRLKKKRYRINNLEPDKLYFKSNESLLVNGLDDSSKTSGLYWLNLAILGPEKILHENNRISVYKKARGKFKFLYTKQTYTMFPDLWVADSGFTYQLQVSNVHPDLKDYNFGTTELVKWVNSSGDTLIGWLIKPEGMEADKKYPMLVYFYDKFSDYYNLFFTPKLNHRPCYPIYTSKGYVIFHPDIKYEVGNPGYDATDCIVSGVRHIIKQGYIDSTKIAIQGHSWGGYQTAFIITQTDLFAAAVAGAPVGNMTSAYSGIRWGTGLARQFQYEKFQSRIGGTLWDSLNNYIKNSPIFNAPKIKTPFMLMFGDNDWAVPWEQGIEIYLAMRRLSKECIFLQYRDEPHWPERYPNRVDYAIKMMEFFDHYILGTPAPSWLTEGIKYRGK